MQTQKQFNEEQCRKAQAILDNPTSAVYAQVVAADELRRYGKGVK